MGKEQIKQAMLVYAVTDRTWLGEKNFEDEIEKICQGGVTCIQLREKNMMERELLKEAEKVKQITDRYGIPFIINDSAVVAKEVDADGVHVGQSDLAIERVRQILGPDKIIGASARTLEGAVSAWKSGADYLGCGAVFGTKTKVDAQTISPKALSEICHGVGLPVVAIGGVNETNVGVLKGTGASGAAFVSAIFAQDNVMAAVKQLRKMAEEIFI